MKALFDTHAMMKSLITENTKELSIEQLAEVYRKTLNPSILADVYVRLYRLVISVSSSYFNLTDADVASYSLEVMDTCLQTYEPEKCAKFSTYFTTAFKNRLRTETQALSTDKRKAIFNSDSYEYTVENGWDMAANVEQDIINIMEDLQAHNLTDKELTYCNYLLQGYSNKEIAAKLQTSVMTLSNIRKNLRVKLAVAL